MHYSSLALTRPQAQVSDTTITTTPSSSTIKVKLPKLSLSYFDGNPARWAAYWDSFQSTIHNHPELSKVDKLRTMLHRRFRDFKAQKKITTKLLSY